MPSTAFLIHHFIVAAHHIISWRYQVTRVRLLRNIGREKSEDLQEERKRGKLVRDLSACECVQAGFLLYTL